MKRLICLLTVLLIAGCTQSSGNLLNNSLPQSNDSLNNTSSLNNSLVEHGEDLVPSDSVNDFANYVLSNPVSVFTKSDIDLLNISCTGSELEVANCIKSWQEDNMIYCNAGMFTDCNDPMRFNFMLPGIYPSSEVILEKVNSINVYGECFSYAITYCSIASYYNLTCRLMNSPTKPSQRAGYNGGPTTGMGPEEYARLRIKLEAKGYDYSYDLMRSIARETFEHYWPEVLIGSAWLPFDASNKATGGNVTAEYIDKGDFEVTNWSSNDPRIQVPVYDFPIGGSNPPVVSGDCVASDITELLSGACNAPYLTKCSDVCVFVAPGQSFCTNDCKESDLSCYESCSSGKYFMVCDFFCARESNFASCYNSCSGDVLSQDCYNQCMGFI